MDSTLSYFAIKPGWGEQELIGFRQDDQKNHLLVIGKTNSGKSTLVRNMIVQDIISGRGLCFIDPHGDEAGRLLDAVPPWRLDQVIYLDPSGERDFPISLNPLVQVPKDERHLIAERVVGIFKAIWGMTPTSMPRAPRVLYNCLRALLDLPPRAGATLLGVSRMLSDAEYRARVVRHVQDPACRAFWTREIGLKEETGERSKHDLEQMFDPILTRVGCFCKVRRSRTSSASPNVKYIHAL
jgi:hypothetical protein